jgi:hypothetical protein
MSITGWLVSGNFVLLAAWPGWRESKLHAEAARCSARTNGTEQATKNQISFEFYLPRSEVVCCYRR